MKNIQSNELKLLLEQKYRQYCNPGFINDDPVSIPHIYSEKQDIEIAAFFSATLAWGRKEQIIISLKNLMNIFENEPYNFVKNFSKADLKTAEKFYYRTFNSGDLGFFLKALKNIYNKNISLEEIFIGDSLSQKVTHFRLRFFEKDSTTRSKKHISDISKGATGKRLMMFLRWMVRKDCAGIDFGIWNTIQASELYLPLDIHTIRAARAFGLLHRKTVDWKAVEEVTQNLRMFDAADPVKYDYALFGMSRYEPELFTHT